MRFLNRSVFRCSKIALILLVSIISPFQSSATTLVGDQIQASLYFPTYFVNQETISPGSGTKGSGANFTISLSSSDLFYVYIIDDYILMSIKPGSTMSLGFSRQLILTGIDWFDDPSLTIESVSLETGVSDNTRYSDPTGIDIDDITFQDHSLTFEYGKGAYWTRTSWAKITLTPSSSGGGDFPSAIPEPSTFIIFACGLLGITGVSRRKK